MQQRARAVRADRHFIVHETDDEQLRVILLLRGIIAPGVIAPRDAAPGTMYRWGQLLMGLVCMAMVANLGDPTAQHHEALVDSIADAIGRDLILFKAPEASMRGAVLLALETIGKMKLTASKK